MPLVATSRAVWSVNLADHVDVVEVSPDGGTTLAGSLSGDVQLIHSASGAVVATLPTHDLGVLSAAWAPSGALVATGGQDGIVRISTERGATVAEHNLGGWIERLAWGPDGRLAVAAGRTLVVISAAGEAHRFPPVSSTITAVAWSGNSARVGVTSYGGLTWFDVDRLPVDTPARRHDFKGSPLSLVLSPSGKWACAGYQDASIHLWPLWSGDDLSMSGYPAKIEHLAFRHDGNWLASACLAELTWWDFSGKGPRGRAPAVGSSHHVRITWLGWQPRGDLLASGDLAGRLLISPSPASTKRPVEPIYEVDCASAIGSAGWLTGRDGLVVGCHDGSVSRLTLP
jgi:WD40 repeat protein